MKSITSITAGDLMTAPAVTVDRTVSVCEALELCREKGINRLPVLSGDGHLAQPRNFIGGHLLSAVIGVAFYKLFPDQLWLASSLSVATAIAVMHATKTLPPPGGATALIAVIGSTQIHDLGYLYVFLPVGAGALIMLGIALTINNIPKARNYPEVLDIAVLFPNTCDKFQLSDQVIIRRR